MGEKLWKEPDRVDEIYKRLIFEKATNKPTHFPIYNGEEGELIFTLYPANYGRTDHSEINIVTKYHTQTVPLTCPEITSLVDTIAHTNIVDIITLAKIDNISKKTTLEHKISRVPLWASNGYELYNINSTGTAIDLLRELNTKNNYSEFTEGLQNYFRSVQKYDEGEGADWLLASMSILSSCALWSFQTICWPLVSRMLSNAERELGSNPDYRTALLGADRVSWKRSLGKRAHTTQKEIAACERVWEHTALAHIGAQFFAAEIINNLNNMSSIYSTTGNSSIETLIKQVHPMLNQTLQRLMRFSANSAEMLGRIVECNNFLRPQKVKDYNIVPDASEFITQVLSATKNNYHSLN